VFGGADTELDHNDCATYPLDDPAIRVYIKVQYDPRFAWGD
jgi:hypothetical protein